MSAEHVPVAPVREGILIQSLQRGLRILDFVAGADAPVLPKQIAAALDLKLGTTYHLVNTLIFDGYLAREQGHGLVLGPRWIAGRSVSEDAPLGPGVAVRRALGRAAYALDDVAVLTTLDDVEALVCAMEEVPGAANAGRYPVGSRLLPHTVAAGRALLATLPPEASVPTLKRLRARARVQGEFVDDLHLLREIDRVRRDGFTTEVAEGVACVGVPVRISGAEPAAIAAVVTAQRLRSDRAAVVSIALKTAAAIERVLPLDGADAARRAWPP